MGTCLTIRVSTRIVSIREGLLGSTFFYIGNPSFSPLFVVMHVNLMCEYAQKLYKPYGSKNIREVQKLLRRRHRRGPRGRMPKPVMLGVRPSITKFFPYPQSNQTPIYLEPAELEALRLVDLEGLSQEDAGERMKISRGTVWRLLQSARRKVAQALTEGRPLFINP